MRAFKGILTLAKTVLVEILVFTFLAFPPLEERAVEERHRMQEHHSRKGDQKDLEQEIRVEPIGREANCLDIPTQCA